MNLSEMLEEVQNLPVGDYAECGVYKGDSAEYIAARMVFGPTLWLFDSFTGHGEPGPYDDAKEHPKGRYGDTDVDLVVERMAAVARIRVMAGFIPGTFSKVPSETRFRFVHIDVDHYAPTLAACQFFLPKMVPGGIIRFDDYGYVSGATKAIDEAVGREALLPGDWRYEHGVPEQTQNQNSA